MSLQLTAIFRPVAEGYIGFIAELPGTNTQGKTLEETRANLREAVALILDANRRAAQDIVDGKSPMTICWPGGPDIIRETWLF
jgi:predicted RNase H-like HicB family nuclease